MAPLGQRFPDPGSVIGVLRAPGAKPWIDSAAPERANGLIMVRVVDQDAVEELARQSGAARPAPYFLSVESETPTLSGVSPAALPQDIPNNHLGYAMTWFGLAAALAGVAGALIRRRLAAT